MFEALHTTRAAERIRFVPVDLPGFSADPLPKTSLKTLAGFVLEQCRFRRARTLVAHSVSSIIASLAARQSNGEISNIVSLEGNLTAEDAYYSGTAADFDDPIVFRSAFLDRLACMASDPIVAGYRRRVEQADPEALWMLGRDAKRFSAKNHPGDVLQTSARVLYLYNPVNCSKSSIEWLEASPLHRQQCEGASHWPTIDQSASVAEAIAHFATV
ncbi:MAG: alpha/beta fold hydrolase [Geminicoccales bacterium]